MFLRMSWALGVVSRRACVHFLSGNPIQNTLGWFRNVIARACALSRRCFVDVEGRSTASLHFYQCVHRPGRIGPVAFFGAKGGNAPAFQLRRRKPFVSLCVRSAPCGITRRVRIVDAFVAVSLTFVGYMVYECLWWPLWFVGPKGRSTAALWLKRVVQPPVRKRLRPYDRGQFVAFIPTLYCARWLNGDGQLTLGCSLPVRSYYYQRY